ncbi:MAG: serine/threonine protein kinase [Deltaproteobacteria bacterium]|nr:serine/threonine protein kinase [Deltaproteobacteria bacterium]
MEREEPLPARIDRYEPLKKLATGGMAEIFLAKQSGLEGFEKVVVLKRILGHLATDDEFVSMFLDEARIAAKLSHPNIVQIYDLGKADNTYYIAMEYVSGRNVQHLITKQQVAGGFLPVEHVCRIIAGVCDGLFYAHSRKDYDGKALNIIHRDISPQNILVSFAGGVKVVDFGIAKASTQLAQTRAGVLKGKYAYMSPEQVRGTKIDHRSDVFAVGLVMYEMLTGLRAFERDSSLKTLKAIVQDKPANPQLINPAIPPEVIKILSRALEKNPDRRYKTAQEFQLAIEDWLEQSPKKSNNVRLSRFLYDLFDDELNSAEGTMVVKGVGQIVVPASWGEKAKPAIEDEVDSKTLTAALVDPPAAAAPAAAPRSARVRDELAPQSLVRPPVTGEASSMKAPARTAATLRPGARPGARADALLKPPMPAPEVDDDADDDADGRTVPSFDMEQLERDRLAHEAAKAGRVAAPAMAGRAAPPPPAATADDLDEPIEKTNATSSATSEASAEASIVPALPIEPDLHARAMLAQVEAIARGPQARAAASPPPFAPPPFAASPMTAPPFAPPPFAAAGPGLSSWEPPNRGAHGAGVTAEEPVAGSPPGPGFAADYNDLADAPTIRPDVGGFDAAMLPTPAPGSAPAPAARPGRPAAWYALAAASAVMGLCSVVLVTVGVLAFPSSPPVAEFGVVVVEAAAPGTTIAAGGTSTAAPGQLALPLSGEHVVEVTHADGSKEQHTVSFIGTNVATLKLKG